jgi:uncharacterized membrane protein
LNYTARRRIETSGWRLADTQAHREGDSKRPGPDRQPERRLFAITLLILDVRVPEIPEKMVASQLPDALLSLWPKYLGYFLSFVGISALWRIHHSIFRSIRAYDRALLFLNFLFLMVVAFVPFPTSLLSEYGDHQLPVVIYAATLAVGRLLLTAIYWHSARNQASLVTDVGRAATREPAYSSECA